MFLQFDFDLQFDPKIMFNSSQQHKSRWLIATFILSSA